MVLKRQAHTLYTPDPSVTYHICKRKPTKSKPALFLLKKEQGKKPQFISSLFGSGSTYSLDYKGVKWSITLSDTEAILEAENV